MRKYHYLLTVCMALFISFQLMGCSKNNTGNEPEKPEQPEQPSENLKTLVVYYSWSGNSRSIANELRSILNCDVVEILPATPYTTDYNTMLNVAQSEISAIDANGSYPAITNNLDSIGDYDTIFICYPLWWSRMSTLTQSFLHKHSEKLNGKTIALICTSGSSGISGTVADARRICPNSVFTEALHIRSANISNAQSLLTQWLETMNISTENTNNNKTMNIKISGGREFTATMVENSSTAALMDILESGPLTIQMHDYGNMEKVGGLGRNLPTNDEQITTQSGDLILYQGNALVIYYAPNTWTFTRLGKINDVTPSELRAALGEGDVTVTLSLTSESNTGVQAAENTSIKVYPNPANDYVQVSGEVEQLTLLNTNGATVAETKENTISVKSLPAGIYFLIIKLKTMKEIVHKIIKN